MCMYVCVRLHPGSESSRWRARCRALRGRAGLCTVDTASLARCLDSGWHERHTWAVVSKRFPCPYMMNCFQSHLRLKGVGLGPYLWHGGL